MKTYIINVIPKIIKFSKKLDEVTLLTNCHWVLMDSVYSNKTTYIFRNDNELLVSINARVTKGKWEYLENNSILIDFADKSYLYKQGFFDTNVLALKTDNENDFSVLINQDVYDGELNCIDSLNKYLENKYLIPYQSKINIKKPLRGGIKIGFDEDTYNVDMDNGFYIFLFIALFVMCILSIIMG